VAKEERLSLSLSLSLFLNDIYTLYISLSGILVATREMCVLTCFMFLCAVANFTVIDREYSVAGSN
jgi:hypothetical protein